MLREISQRIRHAPGLKDADRLWRIVRPSYLKLLNSGGRGVGVRVGGTQVVRMPAEFAGASWEQHEPETVTAFAGWIRRNPGALVLDIGSSLGIFSLVALFADPVAEVVAFDPDLSSIAAARRVCRYASGSRSRLVWGFLSKKSAVVQSLSEAVAATDEALVLSGLPGDVGTTQYVCLSDGHEDIPRHSLDDLLAHENLGGRPVIIKCDVEGAELLVLQGARNLLRQVAPVLSLSVHPPALRNYGHSKLDVEIFLQRLGYGMRILAVDHEEHWWCERP